MTNPKKNFIYNLIYQLLILIVPIITSPYLARVIGANGVGIYSYTHSIVYYFMLVSLLGVNNYGNRKIAKVRDDRRKLSMNFFEIYAMQLIFGFLMLITYILYILIFDVAYKDIALIQSLFIVSSILDINWFFFGMEEFKKTITRNSIVKISSVALIFLLVKNANDVWIYALIMSGSTLISQLILWIFLKRYISFINIDLKNVKKHIIPNLILFLPVVAVSIYKIMDKIMLGVLTNIKEVGLYENAEKIINVPLTIIVAMGTVMLPRISNIVSKGDNIKLNNYIIKSIEFISFLAFPMFFGLMSIGYKFAPLFFGIEFKQAGILIMLLSLTIPFIAFANVLRTQYLIPKEKDKIYAISVSLGAIINLIMNFIFINKYKGIGACFGTIAAEIIVMIYQVVAVRKELPIKKYVDISVKYLMKAFIMFLIIFPMNYLNLNDWCIILCQFIVGGVIYVLINIKYIFSIMHIKRRDAYEN